MCINPSCHCPSEVVLVLTLVKQWFHQPSWFKIIFKFLLYLIRILISVYVPVLGHAVQQCTTSVISQMKNLLTFVLQNNEKIKLQFDFQTEKGKLYLASWIKSTPSLKIETYLSAGLYLFSIFNVWLHR